jgi:glyceraldehyde-3-phosphate dehydrogenase (NADP+)
LWKRAEYLKKAAKILVNYKDEISQCIVNEIAKNTRSALSEVVRTADLIEYVAEQGRIYLSFYLDRKIICCKKVFDRVEN